MSLLSKLEARPTGVRVSVDRPSYVAVTNVVDSGRPPSLEAGLRHEYRLYANIGVNFYANGAERPDAEKQARRQLHHILFKEHIEFIYEAMNMISGGEPETAIKILAGILDQMRGLEK